MLSKLEWQKTLRGASDLSLAEYRVLMTLSTYADAQLENARPGLARLVDDTCLNEKSVKKALSGLVGKSYITLTEPGGNQHGKGRANTFRLLPRPLRGVASTPLPSSVDLSTRGPAGTPLDDPQGDHLTPGKGPTSRPGRGVVATPPSGKRDQVIDQERDSSRSRSENDTGSVTALSDRWQPNHTHRSLAQQFGLHLVDEVEDFRRTRAAAEQRRTNWDLVFSKFLKDVAQGCRGQWEDAPDEPGSRGSVRDRCRICSRPRDICQRAEAVAGANGHQFTPILEAAG